jgi:hypothetical protein
MVTTLCIYIMTVITVKLNEESWAYIITDAEDSPSIEQELAKTIDTAKVLYPDCIYLWGTTEKTNQKIQKTKIKEEIDEG